MTRIAARAAVALVACVASLALGSPASAQTVPPGFDLFETDPEATVFSFREEFTIPPNFFDEGSRAFEGDVQLGGLQLETFNGRDVGDADTVVFRRDQAPLSGPAGDLVSIQLMDLSLQSVAPIQVQVGSGSQLWHVNATESPSRPSEGAMTVRDSPDPGTFDSQLQVFPLFRFTRLTDGATRFLDVGAANLPPQSAQKLVLGAANVPWRRGCVPPARAVPPLNDGFCPAFTPKGAKQLTIQQAQVARHGVRPAQARLEHFVCYGERRIDFKERDVELEDQFGTHGARVVRPAQLCNPARKERERRVNRRAHLECYSIDRTSPAFASQKVHVRNQFGSDTMTVATPDMLCLPTSKSKDLKKAPPALKAAEIVDHFRCYPVAGSTLKRTVVFRDQFVSGRLVLGRPLRLCAPVRKGSTPSLHPVQHLVCYGVDQVSPVAPSRVVRVRNQFRKLHVRVKGTRSMCVPSLKVRAR